MRNLEKLATLQLLLLLGGAFLISALAPEFALAQQPSLRCNGPDGCIARGLCNIIFIATGSFGALVMSVAGVASIISAAIGMYRTCISVIVVGVGTYLIEPMINLFFGYPVCNGWNSTFQALPIGF